jgi:TetR/AcrR family transcriptional repressor of nem operon
MEALVVRMVVEQVEPMLASIVHNPELSALEKLHGYFNTAARWKTARRAMVLSLLSVWYADNNAIFRQKLFDMALKRVTPLLSEIVQQGVREGVFTTQYPEQIGQVIIYILEGLSSRMIELLLEEDIRPNDPRIERTLKDYNNALTEAMERILGAPKGSIHLLDMDILKEWFDAPGTEPEIQGAAVSVEVSNAQGS